MSRGLGLASVFAFCLTAFGQTAVNPPVQASQVIEDMLQLPSPAPPAGVPGKEIPDGPMQNPQFSVPGEDAPLAELGGYWAEMGHGAASDKPVQLSDKVRQRLLEYCEQKPDALDELLSLLPNDSGTFARVKAIYDKNSASLGEDWNGSVKSYLETHGGYFHQELLAEARQVKDDDEMGSPEKHEVLERLATVDWPLAEPLLNQLSTGNQPRTQFWQKLFSIARLFQCAMMPVLFTCVQSFKLSWLTARRWATVALPLLKRYLIRNGPAGTTGTFPSSTIPLCAVSATVTRGSAH